MIGCAALATPAAACRVGGDNLIFVEQPTPPEGPRYATIALVVVTGQRPGPDLAASMGDPRGFPVGAVQVRRVVRGPPLPCPLHAYLGAATSCSTFFSSPKQPFTAAGYVVGRLMVDDRGAYLLLAEQNDTTGAWR